MNFLHLITVDRLGKQRVASLVDNIDFIAGNSQEVNDVAFGAFADSDNAVGNLARTAARVFVDVGVNRAVELREMAKYQIMNSDYRLE